MSDLPSRPPAAPAAPAVPADPSPSRRSEDGAWVVGERVRPEAPVDVVAQAAARRRARLEARLAVYAQYAAVVADEAAAALDGSGSRVRSLAAQRRSLEEQWRELQDVGESAGGLPFDQTLAGALHELEGQSAVEVALRRRLAAITDAAHAPARGLLPAGDARDDAAAGIVPARGAALGWGPPPEHQFRAGAVDVHHPSSAPDGRAAHDAGEPLPPDAALADADAAARAEAIGEAVAGSLGGPLVRAYPGVVARTDPAAYGRIETRAPAPPPVRVNLRF